MGVGKCRLQAMLHLPILRHGVPYKSLDVVRVPHHRTREPFVEISQANAGLIRRDLRAGRAGGGAAALARMPFDRLLAMCGAGRGSFPERHAAARRRRSSRRRTTCSSCRRRPGCRTCWCGATCSKIASVMHEMRTVLRGLTRGLDLSILDAGYGEHGGHAHQLLSAHRRRSASCCRAIRPACTRCGFRPSR